MRPRRRARVNVRTAVLAVVVAWAAGVIPPSPLAPSRADTSPVSGCEHSSNFPAPPGCPDDGSGPRIGPPAPSPLPASAPAAEPVNVGPRFTG